MEPEIELEVEVDTGVAPQRLDQPGAPTHTQAPTPAAAPRTLATRSLNEVPSFGSSFPALYPSADPGGLPDATVTDAYGATLPDGDTAEQGGQRTLGGLRSFAFPSQDLQQVSPSTDCLTS